MRSPALCFRLPARLTLAFLAISCGGSRAGPAGPGAEEPKPANILVSPSNVTLDAFGAQVQFTATVLDQLNRVLPNASVSWNSSDPEVATIDAQGPDSGTYRVTRGGASDSQATVTRSAARAYGWPDRATSLAGLRLVRDG